MENMQKAQLVNLMNSQGWALVLRLAEQSLAQMDRIAIDCDDDTKMPSLAREAKGSRKFWDALINTVTNLKDPSKIDWAEVSTD